MTELLELVKPLKPSRPIVRLIINDDSISLDFQNTINESIQLISSVIPSENCLLNPISDSYWERFDSHQLCYIIDTVAIAKSAMSLIRRRILLFLEKNLQTKKPRSSKLYGWTNYNMPDNTEFNDVLIMVYKYFCTFCDTNMETKDGVNAKNGIALLEAIMEKYEE